MCSSENFSDPFSGNTSEGIVWNETLPGTKDANFNGTITFFPARHVTILAIFVIVCAAAFLNTVTLLMFIKNGMIRSPINYFLINLALVDFLNCTTSLPMFLAALLLGEWPLAENGCKWFGFSFILYGSAALNTTTAIAFDRYETLTPNHACRGATRTRILRSLALVWGVAFAWALAPLCGWSSFRLDQASLTCNLYWHSSDALHYSFSYGFCSLGILLPLSIKAVCYCLVCKRVEKVERSVRYSRQLQKKLSAIQVSRGSILTTGSYRSTSTSKPVPRDSKLTLQSNLSLPDHQASRKIRTNHRSRQRHVTSQMVILVVMSILSWLPFVIITIWASYVASLPNWIMFTTLIANTCSVYDPIAYVGLSRKYRRHFLGALRCHFHMKKVNGIIDPVAPAVPQPANDVNPDESMEYHTPEGIPLHTFHDGMLWGHTESNVALAGSRCKDRSSMSVTMSYTSPFPSQFSPHPSQPSPRVSQLSGHMTTSWHSTGNSTRPSTKLRQFSRDSPEFADIPEVSSGSGNLEPATPIKNRRNVCHLGQVDELADVNAMPEAEM